MHSPTPEFSEASSQGPLLLGPGSVFHGRYAIVRSLASGGMGVVYEVFDQRTNRRRAIKTLLPGLAADAEMRSRFELEAKVTADIESEHIVEIFDAGIDVETATPFIVMELLRGEDLAAILDARGSLSAEE